VSIAARAGSVRQRFDGIDALLVTDLSNIRWLTGFTGSNGWVLLGADGLVLLTDGRYGVQAANQMAAAGVEGDVAVGATGGAMLDELAARTAGLARVGFEAAHVSFQQHGQFAAALAPALLPTSGLVEAERRTKDAGEIEAIERACRIADQALAEVAPTLGDGLTEAQVRNRLELRMRELGASGPSYDTIVATGPRHGALPHHRPTDTLIEPGHLVVIDVGALVDGYHSDMTRTFVVGEPSDAQRAAYDVVLAAQVAGVAAVRPGLVARELDAVCRGIITGAGYGDWFTHGTGHGVGLLIHEDPFVNKVAEVTLQVGDVVTVEPGVYREGFGGIRVEDLVVVTSTGCRVLTASAKDSPCLPFPPTI
jgi:Xaa-Pro aminopeptidase